MKIKSYVLHCKTLHERKKYMQSMIDKHQMDCTWITDHDAPELNDEIKKIYYKVDQEEASRRAAELWKSTHERPLGNGEISIAIKHTIAMEMIASNDDEFALVLEDDCLFCENFNEAFQFYLSSTPLNWDIIHVGNGYGMKPENYRSSHDGISYHMNHPSSRCAEAILIKKSAAQKIIKTMKPFLMAADWELAYQYYINDLNVYWWEPALVTQGSHLGVFKSSLEAERKG
jgi:GR25 family glycosyltransferase involved in LPS biosynthesis